MPKYTYKEIKEIIRITPAELKNRSLTNFRFDQQIQVGHFTKAVANWSYLVFVVNYKDALIEVVTVFGEIQ